MNQEGMIRLIKQRGVEDERVLRAMASVPRHEFVASGDKESAYGDFALSIGYQQTISQPYIVALMTEALALHPGDRVLEIGTGSGYQSAILAEMGMVVFSVERIPELYEHAEERLARLGYQVHLRLADGYGGWPEHAPYDGIIVTAGAPEIPPPLIAQLAEQGRLVIPVGWRPGYQTLWMALKQKGGIERRSFGSVAFVPFISPELGPEKH